MAAWSQRSGGYKVGVCLLVIAGLFFVSGYASPFWSTVSVKVHRHFSQGLWMMCRSYYGRSTCISTPAVGSWMKTVLALQSLCLIGYIVSLMYAMVANCCRSTVSHSWFLEVLAACSGAFGVAGAIVYTVNVSGTSLDFGWSFALDVLGCILILFSAVIIFISNLSSRNAPAGATTGATTGATYAPAPAPALQGDTVTMQPAQINPTGPVYPYQAMAPQPPAQHPQYVQYPYYAPPPGTVWGPPHPGMAPPQGYVMHGYPVVYGGAQNVPQDKQASSM